MRTKSRRKAGKLLWSADAPLLGRETYEGFGEAWPPRAGDDLLKFGTGELDRTLLESHR